MQHISPWKESILKRRHMKDSIYKFLTILISSQVLLAQFTLQNNGIDKTTIQFTQGEVSFEPQGEFTKLFSSNSGTTTDYGQPELPLFSTLIEVNARKEYSVTFNVLSSHTIEDIKIFPFQNKDKTEAPGLIKFKDELFYKRDSFYPESILDVSERLVMRDLHLLNISVVPFQYNPVLKTLEVYDEIEIEIRETGNREDEGNSDRLPSRIFEKLYSTLVLNYEERSRDDDYQDPAILYICGGNSESSSTFQQLVDWRHQRGYVVYTASLSETGSSANSIKNYIQNAYNNFNPAPEYVALVGDVGGTFNIPTFYEDWGHDHYGNQCEGDHPFSQLDGNDLLPEVLIGRISIRSTTDLGVVVNKILHYEKGTYAQTMLPYYEKAALVGDPSSSGYSTVITNEYVEEILTAYDFDDVRLKTSGGSWSSWMQNQLNEGVLYFNYRGYLGVSGFDNSNIDAANNSHKLPFATVLTCGTGSFAEDETCISEKFLRAGSISIPKGGIAAISTATWNTHTLFNNIVNMGIYDGIFAKGIETAGGSLASGKIALYNAYPTNPYNWVNAFTQWNNLMGDPATHLWTDTPENLIVQFEESIPFGTNFLDVHVSSSIGMSVENAMITVLKGNDEIFLNILTNEFGDATLDLDYDFGGDVSLTVSKRNFIPFIDSFEISTTGKIINVNHSEAIVVDDGDNGVLNPGETIDIQIPLKNYGLLNVTGVQAILESTSSYVSVLDELSYYGTMNTNESSLGEGFSLSLSPAALDREDLDLRIRIMDDTGEEWTGAIPFLVNGGNLMVTNDAFIEKNQTLDIPVSVHNFGSIPVENIQSELVYGGDLIEIIDGEGSFGTIASGETITCSDCFTVHAGNEMVNGTLVTLAIRFYNFEGYDNRQNMTLQIGEVSESDPMGPDEYGYYIYDMSDTDYELTPMYEWIEIDPGYGGNGTDLNFSDSGDGNFSNSSSVVNLPFSFRFYGVDYEEITVNSNGWIALGESDMESFRNYPIPGAGGPSPMIAAFWDDLRTTNGGDVFKYTDPGNQYVIIEWSDMRTHNQNSVETFQVILYNNQAPPFGDNEIKIQYKTFNNTSSGNYTGYTPIHGGYATIGIENHLSNDGLEYTFNNNYASSAVELDDGSALFITTNPVESMPAPQLIYTPNQFNFTTGGSEIATDILNLSNQGEPESMLQYSLSVDYPEAELPFTVPGGGPDGFGHYWGDSNITPELSFEWEDISEGGQQIIFSHNDVASDPIEIGFEFPFFGEPYSQFIVNPNGWIGFGEDNTTYQNTPIPSVSAPRPAILAFWDDLSPESNDESGCPDHGGLVYVKTFEDKVVVWFDDVIRCSVNYPGTFDFEVILHDDGGVDINYRNMEGHLTSATIGIQSASGLDGFQIAFNDDYVENELSLQFRKPENIGWLSLYSETNDLSGILEEGESMDINVEVNSEGLPIGEFIGHIRIGNNEQPTVIIPVNLSVISGGEVTINLPYFQGWNLVGLPVSTDDNYYLHLFPDAIEGTMYSFYQGYNIEEYLENGVGYWLRMPSLGASSVTGYSLSQNVINLNSGWNLITGLSNPVDVNTINDPENIIIPFTLYGFSESYVPAEILIPGVGYWVRASDAGTVELITDGTVNQLRVQQSIVEDANSLSFKNNQDQIIQLFFGVESEEEEKYSFSLPPIPPILSEVEHPILDVRFDNEYRVCNSIGTLHVLSSNETEMMNFDIKDGKTWELSNNSTDYSILLTGKGEVIIPGNQSKFTIKIADSSPYPSNFNLYPAFPNPFNPVSHIRFSVPQTQTKPLVSVNVYDVNGALVKALISRQMEPGFHDVYWNASDQSSGMYFVRLETKQFNQTIKTLLIK